jgi:hypothetical protein
MTTPTAARSCGSSTDLTAAAARLRPRQYFRAWSALRGCAYVPPMAKARHTRIVVTTVTTVPS